MSLFSEPSKRRYGVAILQVLSLLSLNGGAGHPFPTEQPY